MKKAIFSLFTLAILSLNATAQTPKTPESVPVFSIADSASFTGKYKYVGLPFEYMTVTVKDGKLYYFGGEYSGFLEPMKDRKDVFDASGEAVFTFVRNGENKVTELAIDYQGQTFTGTREEKTK